MTTPLISIVVPVFDGEDLIGDCIESLLAMDYPEDRREIIVVDNKSNDRTAEIIGRYPVIGVLERNCRGRESSEIKRRSVAIDPISATKRSPR